MARRIATAAVFGGGGIGLLGGAALGLLMTEARLARSMIGARHEDPPAADGRYGGFLSAPENPRPLRLAFLGDSTAVGYGVHRAGETPGAIMASGLAAVADRPVDLVNVACTGATSQDLDRQTAVLARSMPAPDICVIIVGANDVTDRIVPAVSARHLSQAVRRLRRTGAEVVVGTCPDLGTIAPVRPPLRWIARRASRELAAAQTIVVVERGGRTVSLGQLLGPEFAARPRELFGPDAYHPSSAGYAHAAMAILPTVCSALGVWPEETTPGLTPVTILPVARAAATAAATSGTEVTPAPITPKRTPWALLPTRLKLANPATTR